MVCTYVQIPISLFVQVDLCKQLVDQLDSSLVPDKNLIMAGVLAKSGTTEKSHVSSD